MMATESFDESREASPAWQPLGYFSAYRGILAGLLLVLVVWGDAPPPLGQLDFSLFRTTAAIYLVFSVASGFASYLRKPGFHTQVVIQLFVDIVAITLLMYSSGGITSGFGMLLVVAIAGGSILTEGRIAFLFAAIASLAVLSQQISIWIDSPVAPSSYSHTGMLGVAFFATALLAYLSARRIRATEALAARRGVDLANLAELNDHIIQRMQSGILAVDNTGRIRVANESAKSMLGLRQDLVATSLAGVSKELAVLLETWRRDGSHSSYRLPPGAGGMNPEVSFAALGPGAAEGVLVFLEDPAVVTQRAQQLKLASLGRMAASIAHEIRNPLGAVSHANQLLRESPQLDRGDQRLTQIIGDNTGRMNAIVENVLQISRGNPAQPETLDLAAWLTEFLDEFITHYPGDRDRILILETPPSLVVRVDPSQLNQVLWNLCENALYADWADGASRGNGDVPSLELGIGISKDNGRPYVEVRDDGAGIADEVAEHIFEPFYTTRSDGTGLGLFIARELCEGNQASLTHLATESGCCFRVTFSDPRRQGVVAA